MPWKCFIVEDSTKANEPGAMWPVDAPWDEQHKTHWLVMLPNRDIFDIYSKSSDGTYWTVTGDAPNFTVSPSINCKHDVGDSAPWWALRGWHGWLQNGVLSADCEGRQYI